MMMIRNASVVLALAVIAATACTTNNYIGDDDGTPNPSPDDTSRALDAAGRYQQQSRFDFTNLPASVDDVRKALVAPTDSPLDPTEWILDQILAQMPDGVPKAALYASKPIVALYLHERLLQSAPDFRDTMLQAGQNFDQMARNFGLIEVLDVLGGDGTYTGTISATGVHVKAGFLEQDLAFSDHYMSIVTAPNVPVTLDSSGKLDIAEHKLPLMYGQVLRLGLEMVNIPSLDPTARDLATLFQHKVNCTAVGNAISDKLGVGTSGMWSGACTLGLQGSAAGIYAKIAAIDMSPFELSLTGMARAVDTSQDRLVDRLEAGQWTGTMTYATTPSPLSYATFSGTRM